MNAKVIAERDNAQARILVVDDDRATAEEVVEAAHLLGYHSSYALDAASALRAIAEDESIGIVVTDVQMPGMTGLEFAAAVRNGSRWQNTPLVALSSHASQRDLDRGRAAGFDDYVAKFDRDALLYTLSQTLSAQKGAA